MKYYLKMVKKAIEKISMLDLGVVLDNRKKPRDVIQVDSGYLTFYYKGIVVGEFNKKDTKLKTYTNGMKDIEILKRIQILHFIFQTGYHMYESAETWNMIKLFPSPRMIDYEKWTSYETPPLSLTYEILKLII